MGTVPQPKKTEADEQAEHDRAVAWEAEMQRAERLAKITGGAHALLTGSASLKWRRPLLFVVVAAALGAAAGPFAPVGLIALIALAYTDNTTEVVEE